MYSDTVTMLTKYLSAKHQIPLLQAQERAIECLESL